MPVEESEPDYRVTLANERTFLAWIRTSFALVAGGVAIHQLLPPFALPWARRALALGCLALAGCVAVTAYVHWHRVQQAMRRDQPLPSPPLIPLLTASTAAAALGGIALTIWG